MALKVFNTSHIRLAEHATKDQRHQQCQEFNSRISSSRYRSLAAIIYYQVVDLKDLFHQSLQNFINGYRFMNLIFANLQLINH
jgi:hypothetical protein